MRTAITISRTHSGKWSLVGTPDDSLLDQKKAFRALRASKSHKDFSEVVYQESDGHREIIRLLTLEAAEKIEKQAASDHSEAKKFDEAESKRKSTSPEREKTEKEFKAKTEAAEKEEAANKPKK